MNLRKHRPLLPYIIVITVIIAGVVISILSWNTKTPYETSPNLSHGSQIPDQTKMINGLQAAPTSQNPSSVQQSTSAQQAGTTSEPMVNDYPKPTYCEKGIPCRLPTQ